EDRCVDLFLVLVEHLDDVPIAGDIGKLEDITTRGQRCARDLDGAAEGQNRLLVPLVGVRGRRDERSDRRSATESLDYTHEYASSIRSCLKGVHHVCRSTSTVPLRARAHNSCFGSAAHRITATNSSWRRSSCPV